MDSADLYRQLLGLTTPWTVGRVEMDVHGLRVDIHLEHSAAARFACPDCGGNLWEVKGDIVKRYRCHIGHAYTEKDLVVKQAETASGTLWVALRMMEERKHL